VKGLKNFKEESMFMDDIQEFSRMRPSYMIEKMTVNQGTMKDCL